MSFISICILKQLLLECNLWNGVEKKCYFGDMFLLNWVGLGGEGGLPLWLSWWRIHLQWGRPGFHPWVGKIPWRKKRLPTPIFWPGESHELYSPWDHKESDTTEGLSLFSRTEYFLPCIAKEMPELHLSQWINDKYLPLPKKGKKD